MFAAMIFRIKYHWGDGKRGPLVDMGVFNTRYIRGFRFSDWILEDRTSSMLELAELGDILV